MATKITSVSLQDSDLEIIDRFNLSPTALIKERLAEFRQVSSVTEQLMQEKQEKLDKWRQMHEEAINFITKKCLIDEFLENPKGKPLKNEKLSTYGIVL